LHQVGTSSLLIEHNVSCHVSIGIQIVQRTALANTDFYMTQHIFVALKRMFFEGSNSIYSRIYPY